MPINIQPEEIAALFCEKLKHRPPHGEIHSEPCCWRTDDIRCTSADTVMDNALAERNGRADR